MMKLVQAKSKAHGKSIKALSAEVRSRGASLLLLYYSQA